MKKDRKKLELCRETLRQLQDGKLTAARGGVRDTDGQVCSVDTCRPTCRAGCGG